MNIKFILGFLISVIVYGQAACMEAEKQNNQQSEEEIIKEVKVLQENIQVQLKKIDEEFKKLGEVLGVDKEIKKKT